MTKEELTNLIKNLDEESLKEYGIFGIYQYGGGPNESSIKANKEGLQLFALELLRASDKFNKGITENEEKLFSLDYNGNWLDQDSEVCIDFIEPSSKLRSEITEKKETFVDRLTPYGCGALLILIGISILIGLSQILDFITGLFKN